MTRVDALVIGGGPAGLMAADTLLSEGRRVLLAEAKPSLERNFLMAGKSGLNLTKDEPIEGFHSAYGGSEPPLRKALTDFGPGAVQDWAEGLGQAVFTGSSGRVFPRTMKASPLLRAWLRRLDGMGLEVRTRWRWQGWDGAAALFETPEGAQRVTAGATVLAMGGASWARLGSDGAWAPVLGALGVGLAPFAPSN
ncbi:MAG: NAD(P)/FAD-dependent oxidoreductase, partial [Rhodospirillales bacterium]